MRDLETFYGPNAGYVQELYERYLQNPANVDPQTRAVFDPWSQDHEAPLVEETGRTDGHVPFQVSDVVAASALTHAIRERGHLGAHLDPLGTESLGDPALLPETHGITNEDLALLPPTIVGGHAAEGAYDALEAINNLRAMYSGTISYEFDQVKSTVERYWLRDAVGLHLYQEPQSPAASRKLLQRLTQVEVFERYLHQAFPGQKRFSLEGTDALVPMLDELIEGAIESETREVIIGMAHRGRLNVLAHVLGKPYKDILSEFSHSRHEEGVPLTDTFGFGWTGDVKYHLGFEHILGEDASVGLKVILATNPSHMEFVNPVIEGMARASQEMRKAPGEPMLDVDVALPVLIHGDAAFPGEGVVAETLNLWRLPGYWVGGTIHIIINNQLGFTTGPEEARIITQEEADKMVKDAFAVLEEARREADSGLHLADDESNGYEENGKQDEQERPPAVSAEQLARFNTELLTWPEGFTPNTKLARLLQRRATTLSPEGGIDWGQAEELAFASILTDGTPIRLTGQDVERGTFSHRHAVLHDQH